MTTTPHFEDIEDDARARLLAISQDVEDQAAPFVGDFEPDGYLTLAAPFSKPWAFNRISGDTGWLFVGMEEADGDVTVLLTTGVRVTLHHLHFSNGTPDSVIVAAIVALLNADLRA